MKVLHVLRDLSRNGGVQRLVFDMAMSSQPGLDIAILITNRESGAEYLDELREGGVTVHIIPRWNFLAHAILYRQFDIVHGHLFPALYLVGILAKVSVYTEHSTINNRRKVPLSRFIETFIYSRFSSITCITPEVKISLCEFLISANSKRMKVIYNGVNTETVFNDELKREGNDCNIAMIGSLSDKKDQETIIKSLPFLDCHVLHLAGDGAKKEELVRLSIDNDVSDRVVFHGLVTDISVFLAGMDIYVQSSKFEGFGLAAVEGMAAGLPVLCSDVPGLAELTGQREGLFRQGDHKQLSDCIRRISDDEGFKKQLLEISRVTSEKYSLRTMNENFLELYKGLI